MSKPKRNKALAVLDGRLEVARQEHLRRMSACEESMATLKELTATRELVAKAYERPKVGRPAGKRDNKPRNNTPAPVSNVPATTEGAA
jgi:anti-sigma factor RsiW